MSAGPRAGTAARARRVLAAAGVLGAMVAACRGDGGAAKGAAPDTRVVTDAIGREVRVPADPRRIVSLAPAITETLYAVGAGAKVVGVTRFCNFPAEVETLPDVGGFADPNVERIAQLGPDLVILTADTVTRERFDALLALGIPAWVTNAEDFEGVSKSIRDIGALVGRAAEGEALARELDRRRLAVSERVGSRTKPRVLFLFQATPAIAAGKGTFLDELVRAAGGENVAVNAPTSYPRLGLEGILALAPDVVLTTMPETAETLRGLLAGSPIPPERIIPMEADLVERPGPRLVIGLEKTAAILHPEAFR